MSDDPDWRSDADEQEIARQAVYQERVAKTRAKDEARRADELAARLLILAALRSAVAEEFTATKEALAGSMSPGDLKRPQINGAAAGSVSYSAGAPGVTVTDTAALTAWVEEHYTTELELEVRIRPAFLELILEATKDAGEPCGPGGELEVPGVSVRSGTPRITVTPDKTRVAELLAEARRNPFRLITSQEQP